MYYVGRVHRKDVRFKIQLFDFFLWEQFKDLFAFLINEQLDN